MVPLRPTFSTLPLFVLAVAFAAGALFGVWPGAPPRAWPLACCAFFTVAALLALRKHWPGRATACVVLAFACAGAVLARVEADEGGARSRVRSFYEEGRIASGDPVEVTGVLERAPEPAPDGLYLALRAEALRHGGEERAVRGAVELFAHVGEARAREGFEALELRRGARVRVALALERAEEFQNPGVSSRTEFLERRGFDARGTVKSHLLVERLDDEPVFVPRVWLEEWRAFLLAETDRLFTVEAAGVLKASLLGNRHGLTRETAEKFREGGTFHVLVISGLHVTFLGGLAWAVARRFTRRRVLRWAASACVVWAYAVAVGAESSVVRAALMFTLAALAPALGRRASTVNALGGAALLLLVWSPRSLLDPSFQLTFLCVLSIVALGWPLVLSLKAVGEWRPTAATPHPPVCPRWWRALGECLFWSERAWRRELGRSTHSYRLFKTPLAARLERARLQKPLRYAFVVVLVSAVVQAGLLPLSVLYFHRLPLASLVLNVWVGALMIVLSFAALAALLLAQASAAAAAPFVWLAERTNWLMAHGVDPFDAARLASLRLPEYTGAPAAVYVLYYAPLVVLALALARWRPVPGASPPQAEAAAGGGETSDTTLGGVASPRRGAWGGAWPRRVVGRAALAQVVLLFLVVAHPRSAAPTGGRLRVDFLDVGQGDAALLTMPDGTTLLVDAGGRPRFGARGGEDDESGEPFERDARGVGERVVSEYLWRRGLDRVNYVLATHAHADHIEGLADVAKNFRVDAALVARAPAGDEVFRSFARAAARANVPAYLVGRGDRLRFGAVTLDVLWPPRDEGADAPSHNDDSVVLRVRFGQRTFLLTGDIEAGAEAALIAAGDDLRADAVKVAHHGSRTSSTEGFVGAARPRLAVIPVGLSSPHGHPHPTVVARWRASGAQVLTTGERGTITVSTDGDDLKIENYVRP